MCICSGRFFFFAFLSFFIRFISPLSMFLLLAPRCERNQIQNNPSLSFSSIQPSSACAIPSRNIPLGHRIHVVDPRNQRASRRSRLGRGGAPLSFRRRCHPGRYQPCVGDFECDAVAEFPVSLDCGFWVDLVSVASSPHQFSFVEVGKNHFCLYIQPLNSFLFIGSLPLFPLSPFHSDLNAYIYTLIHFPP